MENKKNINILMISGITLFLIIFLFKPKCLFMKIFHIPCTMCGMTRAFIAILNFDLLKATHMNVLSIPLFIIIIVFILLYIANILFKKDYIYKFYNYIVKNYKLLIIVLVINWIINIVNNLYYK